MKYERREGRGVRAIGLGEDGDVVRRNGFLDEIIGSIGRRVVGSNGRSRAKKGESEYEQHKGEAAFHLHRHGHRHLDSDQPPLL